MGLLLADLRERGIVTKVRQLSDGGPSAASPSPEARSPIADAKQILLERGKIGEDSEEELTPGASVAKSAA
jgi:hypothetical protein